MLESTFQRLFTFLKDVEYSWEPVCPERLVRARRSPGAHSALVRYFGLGLDVAREELAAEGLPEELWPALSRIRPGVSRVGSTFVAHAHWGGMGRSIEAPVYLGQESFQLLRQIQPHLESFVGKRVLDLGSGAGALSFEVAPLAHEVLGIEASRPAVDWARATAQAQGIANVSFRSAFIGTPEADACAAGGPWEIAISNPPMAIPIASERRIHRDGGKLGIELPLLFMDFARRHLVRGGEAYFLATNPIVHGRSVFFDRLNGRAWEIGASQRLNSHFNQEIFRKEGYGELGIQRVELWFLKLIKR